MRIINKSITQKVENKRWYHIFQSQEAKNPLQIKQNIQIT